MYDSMSMRIILAAVLLALCLTKALAQTPDIPIPLAAPSKTDGNIAIWRNPPNAPAPNSIGDTGNATAPNNFTVKGNLDAEGTINAPGAHLFDPRAYGAKCGIGNFTTWPDATAALQETINQALARGASTVVIPCPLRINGQVNIGVNGAEGGIRLRGTGAMYTPAQRVLPWASSPGNIEWPPTKASAIVCASTTAEACLLVRAAAVEIDHINFGNVQPVPPDNTAYNTGARWNPTVYPFIIKTGPNTGWQGLNLHDLMFTSTSKAIGLEGAPVYQVWDGTQITIENIWCNACLEVGISIRRLDNQIFMSHVGFVPSGYYFDQASIGDYLRNHAVGLDIQFDAAPQFHDLNFFTLKSAIQIRDGDVCNNFSPGCAPPLVIGMSAGQFTNVMFNEVCQAVTLPNAPNENTNVQFKMTNVDIWADESGFQCAKGKALFDMPSNKLDVSLSHVTIQTAIDTFANAGCGQQGVAGCGGRGLFPTPTFRLADIVNYYGYGHWTAGAPFIRAPSITALVMPPEDLNLILPDPNGGKIIDAGHDGTIACMNAISVGGGTHATDGAVLLDDPCTAFRSGAVSFWNAQNQRLGYVGYHDGYGLNLLSDLGALRLRPQGDQGLVLLHDAGGLDVESEAGAIRLKAEGGAGLTMYTGDNGTHNIANFGSLPTTCVGHVAGDLYADNGFIKYCP